MTLQDWVDYESLQLETTPFGALYQCRIPCLELQQGAFLSSVAGSGSTSESAERALAQKLSGRHAVINSSTRRREVKMPAFDLPTVAKCSKCGK